MASVQMVVFFVVLLTSHVTAHQYSRQDVRCRYGDFQCVTVDRCIPSEWKCNGRVDCEDRSDEKGCGFPWWVKAGAMVGAGALAVVAAPVVVAGLGFGAAGIGAGTVAAGAMSTAATTGVGMGAVSTLQAIGATGALTAVQAAVVGGVGAGAAGASKAVYDHVSKDEEED